MIRKIVVLAVLSALALACDPLSRSEMTLTFDDTGERVNIDVVSDDNHLNTYHSADRDHVGDEVLAGRDEWSLRFARTGPQDERLVINRSKGVITRLENQASIDVDDLQKFFSDDGLSIQVTHGDGWAELTIYPGASTRASRRDQEKLKAQLDEFSHRVVRYFDAVRDMYRYLDANGDRAEELFYAVYSGLMKEAGKEEEKPQLSKDEEAIVERVAAATTPLIVEEETKNQLDLSDFSRIADLAYNPFPAVIDVRVPGEPLAVEGFDRNPDSGLLRATTAKPDEVLRKLEGRWLVPDLFSAAQRQGEDRTTRQIAAAVAKERRSAAPAVNASEVIDALVKGMQPASRYRVRWVTKGAKGVR